MKADTTAHKPTFTHQMADEEKSMPLGVGDMNAEAMNIDPLAGASESRRFGGGSMLIVVVVVLACGGLWFMRSLAHVSGASAASDVEKAIESFLGSRDHKGNAKVVNGGTDPSVLAVLSASYIEKQVPLQSVQRNPFISPGENDTPMTAPIPGEAPEAAIARARSAKQKEIDSATARLSVKSIIMSAQPIANLSGMIVRVGDEIAPEGSEITFRIQEITADSILLVTDDLALGMHVEVPISMRRDL